MRTILPENGFDRVKHARMGRQLVNPAQEQMSFAEKGAAVSREQLLHALAMVFTIVQKRAVKVGGFVGAKARTGK